MNAERMGGGGGRELHCWPPTWPTTWRKGVPFREAHEAVARLVRYAEEQGKAAGRS